MNASDFLPLTSADFARRGWDAVDIVLITGDAYIDHPAFGAAVIGRVLEHAGYRVGIIAMPDWNDPASVTVFGKPRLFFGVTAGNVDSMLARYTAFKRYRSDDPYVPGGQAGRKPERAVLVYCNLIKAAYKDVPIVIGGVEASMRRIAHYDFWSNAVRRSIIVDARADVLIYGMGEQAIVTVARRIAASESLDSIPGTVILSRTPPEKLRTVPFSEDQCHCEESATKQSLTPPHPSPNLGEGAREGCSQSLAMTPLSKQIVMLPAEENVLTSSDAFLELYRTFYRHYQETLIQPTGKRFLYHFPPPSITPDDLDAIYALPYQRQPHPSYTEPIPAFAMIRDSITAHRGCVSGCSFCSLSLHQGKRIVSRSPASVLKEVETVARQPGFKGHITDIGGPSANMYGFDCARAWQCDRESCVFPKMCRNLRLNTRAWLNLLDQASRLKGVKKVTVGSGIRYDLLMREPEHRAMLVKLLAKHISGQLKIAPEHTSAAVLRAMRKTPLYDLKQFVALFREITASLGKAQYPLPYLMSCHPGSTQSDMQAMQREVVATFKFTPQQVQAFIPLPMTLSSVIYYTGQDPLTGEQFAVVRDMQARRKQHEVFFQKKKESS